MEQLFITDLMIKKVRHLQNISIPLSKEEKKHLILTGKNGSGKTSIIEALAIYLDSIFTNDKKQRSGLAIQFNKNSDEICALAGKDHYVLAYYRADRIFQIEKPKHVQKVQLKDHYSLKEYPRNEFVKYLLDLKMTEALARNNKKTAKADKISEWFENLELLLKQIFDDESVVLEFDEETFEFHIVQQGKELFDFNTLSSGYQAVLDIVVDLMMRMQHELQRSFDFHFSGIVLIDEIETHLHLELQKNIMPLLTTVFPNIQFIITTHSPFILNSLENVVIYDLENHLLVENGLDNVPYEGIVEGYFRADRLSHVLKEKFEKYKSLVKKEVLADDDLNEIAELELYLDELPAYLSFGVSTEYEKLKLEFMNREDVDG